MRTGILVLAVVWCGAALPAQAAEPVVSSAASEPSQMLDFNLSGYGAKGEKTWEVQGAQMDMQGKDVEISDITAKWFGEKENMTLTADRGNFDKESGVIYLRDNVRAVTDTGMLLTTDSLDWSQDQHRVTTKEMVNVTKDNLTATGQGVDAQPDLKVAKFEKDVTLTLKEERPTAAGKPGAPMGFGPGKMVITCDGPMELNYDKNYAVFEENVRVDGGAEQGTMIADRMTVTFNAASRQIDRIEATGNVRIIRGENTSYSDGAVFLGAERRILLTGRPKLVIFPEEGGADVSP